MDPEDEVLSQWQAAQQQFPEVGQASAPGHGSGLEEPRLEEWRKADFQALGDQGTGLGGGGWEIQDTNPVCYIECKL